MTRRIEFVILRTGRSLPVAPHPASRRRSYVQLQGLSAAALGRTFTYCHLMLSGALVPSSLGSGLKPSGRVQAP
jgi:hypothetical protein